MIGSAEKFAAIQKVALIENLDPNQLMFFPPTQQAQNTELALFLMGMFQNKISINFETLTSILSDLVNDLPES